MAKSKSKHRSQPAFHPTLPKLSAFPTLPQAYAPEEPARPAPAPAPGPPTVQSIAAAAPEAPTAGPPASPAGAAFG
jgi:hypothetical protein